MCQCARTFLPFPHFVLIKIQFPSVRAHNYLNQSFLLIKSRFSRHIDTYFFPQKTVECPIVRSKRVENFFNRSILSSQEIILLRR